ncbi:extracellular solute-binding protein [Nocardioides sp. GCM10028917]|uniref:extracellular solute-binding protein n=1 Tax=Nocardioides sp. GCM10028917 TaxID=3273408 RepID=UPI003611D199
MSRSSRRRSVLLAATLTVALATAACTADAEPDPEPTRSPTGQSGKPTEKPREVTFGAYGTEEEVAAFQSVVDSFNASSTTRKVTLQSWPDHESALADVLAGNAPDAFLTSRIDLDELVEGEALQPVSLLLDERGVDFGDRFSRDAVDAFAMDDELQCMAYSVSPMVVYYNTDLVDFDKMERRGLDVPGVTAEGKRERWTLAEFEAAARFASRRGDPRGVWIDPTLQGLAPFIYSGDGQVFDDDQEPTSLAFSDDNTREALSQTLFILRDSSLTPTNAQLARATPVQLFKRGELAMVAGFRNLVPEMREAEDLDFDVLPMPTIDTRATVGDISGLCISADSEVTGDAADFIAYAVSDAAIATVASTGYIVPANTSVAASPEFLAPDDEPASADVFNQSIRYMVVPPFIDQREELNEAVTPLLERLVTAPGPLDLEAATEEIDLTSQEILSPEEPEETETSEPTEDPSESPSQ